MSPSRRELQKSLRTDFAPGVRVRLSRARSKVRRVVNLPGLVAGGELDRPIFIIGAPRSGTSLLFRIIATSPQTSHWPGEAHEIWERDHHPALHGWESSALTAEDADAKSAARIRRSFYLVAGRDKRLVDKTPRNSLRVSFVDRLFPEARYIFLQRDGRDNVNSLITAWRTPRYRTYRLPEPHAIPGVPDPNWWKFVLYPGWREDIRGPLETVGAKQWVHSNEAALRDLATIPQGRWTIVRYEDLIARPEDEVARLARFLDLDVDERLREEAGRLTATPINIVTAPAPEKWKRENPTEIETILPLISPTMERLGYAP
jgi:hypothetical protein